MNEANGAKDIGYTGNLPFVAEATTINEDYNYRYDQLGNLAKDVREGIDTILWTVAGKVKQVEKTDGTVLTFAYGADGQRLWKEVTPPVLDDTGYREYYIRDAQGNIMATYRSQLIVVPSPEPQGYAASLRVTERPVYGSSRLGTYARGEELYDHPVVSTPAPDPVQPVDLNYELTDHLGNVTAVVTGRLLNGNGGGSPKQAELVSAQGYEAFGALLPGRNYSSDSYRFGFQGQEKDDEMYGATGASYAFEYRMYDARLGRFFSVDPLCFSYRWQSPYAFAANNPIRFIEVSGAGPGDPPSNIINNAAQIRITTTVMTTGGPGMTPNNTLDWNIFDFQNRIMTGGAPLSGRIYEAQAILLFKWDGKQYSLLNSQVKQQLIVQNPKLPDLSKPIFPPNQEIPHDGKELSTDLAVSVIERYAENFATVVNPEETIVTKVTV